jgi:hypothetical protein
MNVSSPFEVREVTEGIILTMLHYERASFEMSSQEEPMRLIQPIPSVSPLFAIQIGGKSYKLSRPIEVRITKEDNLYFVENEVLMLYGCGESIQEAIDDLAVDIFHFWQYYRNLSPTDVIGIAVKLKEIYDKLTIEEQ